LSVRRFQSLVGTMPETSPGKSTPVGWPKPHWWAQYASRSMPSMPASRKKNVSLECAKPP
jgi:hypothetical protein